LFFSLNISIHLKFPIFFDQGHFWPLWLISVLHSNLFWISNYKKICKKKTLKEYWGSNAWRSELQPLTVSARLCFLLVSLFYELCNMEHMKTSNNFLQIIDNNKSWFTVNYRKAYIMQHIENSAEGSKMFFPFRSTPRKHWQPRGSRRTRAVTRIARAVCEADVHVCVKIARAFGLEHALGCSHIMRDASCGIERPS